MPISRRFVIKSTIVLLTVGFLTLLSIVGMTIWLGEKAQIYLENAIASRDTRTAAVELRSAVQSAESSQRGFLVGGNDIYLAPYETAKTQSETQDRKSTRLNSSHLGISYAVFCLKKKKK